MRIYISADMEGVGGVVTPEQVSVKGGELYAQAARWMAEEVRAVIEGARAAGATEFVVNDAHGSMRNIPLGALDGHPAVLISGQTKGLTMMHGIDDTFAGAFFLGYHARAGSSPGVLDHSYNSRVFTALRLDGQEAGEVEINARVAGYFGVPVLLATGDQTLAAQVRDGLPGTLAIAVKQATGRMAAVCEPRAVTLARLRDGARAAVEGRLQVASVRPAASHTLEAEYVQTTMADIAELIPGTRRTGGRRIAYTAANFLELYRLLTLMNLVGNLALG